MKTLSVEQQINNFRPMAKSGLARNFHYWLLGSAAALIILSIVLWHPVPLMIGIFLGIVGLAEQRSGPNIEAAVTAFDAKDATIGEVTITSECWDMDDHYYALVREHGQPDWTYEFIPQGWKPETGTHKAKIWRSGKGKPPILAATENGIMVPRNDPSEPAAESRY